MIKTIETEQGLLIPKEELAPLGDFVVERQAMRIIIRPRSMTEATRGIVSNGDSEASDRLMAAIEDELI